MKNTKKSEIIKKLENLKNLKELIEDECYKTSEFCNMLNLEFVDYNKRIITEYLNKFIKTHNCITVDHCKDLSSRIIIRYKDDIDNWFNHEKLKQAIIHRLSNNLVINYADKDRKIGRYVVAIKNHKRASASNQVKAHIILWELHNKQLFPEGCVLVPIDGNFLNLTIDNFTLYTNEEYRSIVATDKRNHFYKTGSHSGICYKGGWKRISNNFLKNNTCKMCGESTYHKLNSHHIISYYLFDKPKDAHFNDNLICLCDSCHAKVHANNLNISGYLSERVRLNLIELLEQLKNKFENSELYQLWKFSKESISSQASIVEEGSTTSSKERTSQANGDGSGEPLTGKAEGEDIV